MSGNRYYNISALLHPFPLAFNQLIGGDVKTRLHTYIRVTASHCHTVTHLLVCLSSVMITTFGQHHHMVWEPITLQPPQ